MNELLVINESNENRNITYKTPKDFETECTNCNCVSNNDIFSSCSSIKRIIVILAAYNMIMRNDLFERMPLSDVLIFDGVYTLTEIHNDFFHIKEIIDDDKQNQKHIRARFRETFDYTNSQSRSRRGSREKCESPLQISEDDLIVQQTCEKILTYLLFEYKTVPVAKAYIGKPYIGKAEDDEWWRDNILNDDEMYYKLLNNIGVFRWQSYHGFNSKQHQALMHLKPRYENIKEEALHNPYCKLSKDNWNQTLRKSKVFSRSFASKRIKTTYAGKYDDKITGEITKWGKEVTINLKEIVAFKLYTDFDHLQRELKKCFRYETISHMLRPHETYSQKYDLHEQNNRVLLEQRLEIFYFWRIKLSTVLTKYAQALDPTVKLYHGVNTKMFINYQRMHGFCGPLSTTTSHHVAKTFATAKGMVIELTTQFPRLEFCKGFDASLISDYPEEKECIISFVYLRIKKVMTRPFNNKYLKTFEAIDNDNDSNFPLSSKTRSIFWALHLFQQQIFSMDIRSEYWLCGYLYLHCGYDELKDNNDNNYIKKTKFVDFLKKIHNYKGNGNSDESDKYKRILNILGYKFDDFRKYPNQKQILKIDGISHNLKPYFMDYIGLDIHKKEQYVISFSKITKIYKDIKEIHFINEYKFDKRVLHNLIQYLFKNPTSNLQMVKFLYFDRTSHNNELVDQVLLNRLKNMKWNIRRKSIGAAGYEIKLYSNGKLKESSRKVSKFEKYFYGQYSSINIPRSLTKMLPTGTLMKIPHYYDYILKSYSLHGDNQYLYSDRTSQNIQKTIKIFNLSNRDITTNESLFLIAEPDHDERRNFNWKMIPKIFTANDIRHQFGISECVLPPSWKTSACFTNQLNYKSYIKRLLQNDNYMINNTQWHKQDIVVIYNKVQNTKRLEYKIEKEQFKKALILSMKNVAYSNNKLIPILMPNASDNGHHVEFIKIVKIKILKEDCILDSDIGISYRYNYSSQKLEVVGIHLDKYLMLNHHQLITEYHECNCFENFKSIIDHLVIGNPDNDKNNANRYKTQSEKQTAKITELKKKLKPARLSEEMNNDYTYNSSINDEEKSVHNDEDFKLEVLIDNDNNNVQILPSGNDDVSDELSNTCDNDFILDKNAPAFYPSNYRMSSNLTDVPENKPILDIDQPINM